MKTPSHEIYDAVENAYKHFNQALFAGRLPYCLIVLQRQPKMMGYVSHKRWINANKQTTDELAINPEYFLGFPLIEIMQTLVHEQCHIWQNHFGTPGRRGYHNKEWADKMQEIGLMPSHTGSPGGMKTGEKMNDYVILGSRFQQEFESLLETGFQIPWLDRIPARQHQRAINIFNPEGLPADKVLPQQLMEHINLPAGGKELSIDNLDKPINSFGENETNEQSLSLPIEMSKRNTRIKYRCESCNNQVWGKPSMHVICGNCNIRFLEL
jgi:predicted SprT family Zn-dependent metalloprotease